MNDIILYIQSSPPHLQLRLQEVYSLVKRLLPNAEQTIKYGIPTFVINKKNVFHFGIFKEHIGLYPGPVAILNHKNRLKGLIYSKGAIKIPHEIAVPSELIQSLIQFNLNLFAEAELKKKLKKPMNPKNQ